MPLDPCEDCCHLEAERYGNSLLEVATADHWYVSISARQAGEQPGNSDQVVIDDLESLTNLQDRCRIRDVLSGRAPVAVLAELIPAKCVELRHHAEHGIADALGLCAQFIHVDLRDIAVADDLVSRLAGNDAKDSLNAGKRLFDFEILRGPVFV